MRTSLFLAGVCVRTHGLVSREVFPQVNLRGAAVQRVHRASGSSVHSVGTQWAHPLRDQGTVTNIVCSRCCLLFSEWLQVLLRDNEVRFGATCKRIRVYESTLSLSLLSLFSYPCPCLSVVIFFCFFLAISILLIAHSRPQILTPSGCVQYLRALMQLALNPRQNSICFACSFQPDATPAVDVRPSSLHLPFFFFPFVVSVFLSSSRAKHLIGSGAILYVYQKRLCTAPAADVRVFYSEIVNVILVCIT
jgi:hypothetical protein